MKHLLPLMLLTLACSTQNSPSSVIVKQSKSVDRQKVASLAEQYNDFMLTHPASEKVASCKSINFRSDRRLRRNQKNLFLNNPQMAIPNYNGIYLLLENPIGRGSEWFVVSCKTGKLETVFPLVGDIIFRPESSLIVTKTFGDFDTLKTYQQNANGLPQIYTWESRRWVKIENPIQK